MRFRRPRVHDDAHLEFIRQLPCVSCGNDIETQAAHLRSENRKYGKTTSGMQMKPDDRWTLPLCGRCHDEQHRGNEKTFWKHLGVNPWVLALSLHAASGDYELAQEVIREQVHR
jgi:hypothetical protein